MPMEHIDRVVQAVVIRAFGQPSVTAESGMFFLMLEY